MGNDRKIVIQLIIILTGILFSARLLNIQVLDDTYAKQAEDNIIHKETQYPYRGLIYDRNNKLLVFNKPEYDLIVTPREVKDINVSEFCELFEITEEEYQEKLKDAKRYSYVIPTTFIKQLSEVEFAKAQDRLDDFQGFDVKARTGRGYNYNAMANGLGYISEITKSQLNKDTTGYYSQGDYIGQSGIESYYEEYLRGKRGVKYLLKNVKGEDKGSFNDGEYDTLAVPGQDLISTVDIDLQLYGEFLMKEKSGSIVAIEPATGEILSFVSGPSYDPTDLTGRRYSKNYSKIASDTNKPLFIRPLMAQYRPGSIFKIAQAMVGLELNSIVESTRIVCNRNLIGCHGAHSYEDLEGAITHSCNPYFYNVMRRTVLTGANEDVYEDSRIGLKKWREYIMSFGFGDRLGIDMPNEKTGLIPGVEYYDRAYNGEAWKFSNIYSLAIGEGENLVVPIQMANFAATVANRGFYYTPHLVKSIGESGRPLDKYTVRHETKVASEHFDVAVAAMRNVVMSGTGFRADVPGLNVCGKTGTVQNDPLPDHSVFIAFAPMENPQIAVSVYVEDMGQGARAAASIAGLMIEKYINREIKRKYIEDYTLRNDFLY